MTELTLENIYTFLDNNKESITQTGCDYSQVAGVSSSKITDIDHFLMNKIVSFQTYTSPTRKDNFLTLYNDRYIRNLEVVAGIFFISAVLGKMMFYPIVI